VRAPLRGAITILHSRRRNVIRRTRRALRFASGLSTGSQVCVRPIYSALSDIRRFDHNGLSPYGRVFKLKGKGKGVFAKQKVKARFARY